MHNGRLVQIAIVFIFAFYGMNMYVKTHPMLSMSFLLGGMCVAGLCEILISAHDSISMWWYSCAIKLP